MLVPLLPLILAANVSVPDSDWSDGAELIYNGNIVGWTPPLDESGQSMIFNTTLKMRCRLNSQETLECYLDEPRVVVTLMTASGESRVVVNSTDKFATPDDPKDRFDVTREGSKFKIAVPRSLHDSEIVFLKLLIDQLNIAANWNETDGERQIDDYSNLGNCKAKFVMATADGNRTDDEGADQPRKIVIAPESAGQIVAKVLREIQKIRDVDSCYVRFGTTDGVDLQLKSSVSRTIITEDGFTSFTENELIFRDRSNPNDTGKIGRERVTLSLERIVPVRDGPLPAIKEPFTTWPNQMILSLFNSDSFGYLIKKPQRQFDFWLAAARGKQISTQ